MDINTVIIKYFEGHLCIFSGKPSDIEIMSILWHKINVNCEMFWVASVIQ